MKLNWSKKKKFCERGVWTCSHYRTGILLESYDLEMDSPV